MPVADQYPKLGIEIAGQGCQPALRGLFLGPVFDRPVQCQGGRLHAVQAQEKVLFSVFNVKGVIAAPGAELGNHRWARSERRATVPVSPLGQCLFQLQLDWLR